MSAASEFLTECADISAHEFDVPCEVTSGGGEIPCAAAAAWLLVTSRHCTPGIRTKLICEAHYEWLIAGGFANCLVCHVETVWRDRVVRLERWL